MFSIPRHITFLVSLLRNFFPILEHHVLVPLSFLQSFLFCPIFCWASAVLFEGQPPGSSWHLSPLIINDSQGLLTFRCVVEILNLKMSFSSRLCWGKWWWQSRRTFEESPLELFVWNLLSASSSAFSPKLLTALRLSFEVLNLKFKACKLLVEGL